MNKRLISYVTLMAFAITCVPGRADVNEEITSQLVTSNTAISDTLIVGNPTDADAGEDYDYYEPEGTEVGEGDSEAKKASNRQMWINIGLAITAVVVAVTENV